VFAALCSATSVMAQSPPAANGNRANGFSYQPTPGEVAPRERAAGMQPPAAQREQINRDLERTDKKLLQDEGLSIKSVPKITTGQ
jgi:hypothetical protein